MTADQTPANGVLESPGVFRMRVAPGWSVVGIPGHRYDLQHATLPVNATVSVHHDDSPAAATAPAMVRAYARRMGAPDGVQVVEATEAEHDRAFARFVAGGERYAVIVMRDGADAVLASTNAPASDADACEAGEALLETLAPDRTSRGRFGRRTRRR